MGKIDIKDGFVVLEINPKVYDLEVIYSAAYVFLDNTYVLLDGDPETNIIVKLKPKEEQDLEKLGMEFFNELVNHTDYKNRAEKAKGITEMILQRALITNDPSLAKKREEDPKEIMVPWEEKHENKAE